MKTRRVSIGILAAVLLVGAGCRSPIVSVRVPPERLASSEPVAGPLYFLPKVRLLVTLTNDAKSGASMTVQPLPAEADAQFAYSLRRRHLFMADDHYQIAFTNNGLLASITTSNVDQTGAVIGALGQLAANIVKAGATFGLLDVGGKQTEVLRFVLDPSDSSELKALNTKAGNFGLELELDGMPDAGLALAHTNGQPATTEEWGGVFYRQATLVVARVSDTKRKAVLSETPLLLPNFGPPIFVRIRAWPLGTTVHGLRFENGVLAEMSGTDPNQVMGCLTPLVDTAKAFASIPGEILTLRIQSSKADKEAAEARKAAADADKAAVEAQKAAEEAKRAASEEKGKVAP
jgi:hypothetical protein